MICMIMTILCLLLVRNKYSRKVSFHLSLCATAPVFGTPLTNSTSVQLTWSPVTPGSVQSYRLTITGGGTQQTATVLVPGRDHVFSGLTPFTEYTVTIAAVDTMNREGVMTTRTVTTAKSGMNE